MKTKEKLKLKNAEKIELVKYTKLKGFTKEEQEEIINKLVAAYNVINCDNYGENLIITVNNFKLQTYYIQGAIIECLSRFKAVVKNAEEEENNAIEIMKKHYYSSNSNLIKTSDNFISNGNIALIVDNIPECEKMENIKDKIYDLFCDNYLIKLSNYKTAKKQGIFVFYRDLKNYAAFKSDYISLLDKESELYLTVLKEITKPCLIVVKNKKVMGVIVQETITENFIKDKFSIIPIESDTEESEKLKLCDVIDGMNTEKKHYNPVTKRYYQGNNALELEKAFKENDYKCTLWVGKNQAKKMKKQLKENAHGVVIKVYYTDDDGRSFCKFETVYNVAELEEIKKQKIENMNIFKQMIERLKKAV